MIGHSAEKRHRQSVVANSRNRIIRSRIRGHLRVIRETAYHPETHAALIAKYYTLVDRAAKKGVFHAKTASRYKSRAMQVVARIKDGSAPPVQTQSRAKSRPKSKAKSLKDATQDKIQDKTQDNIQDTTSNASHKSKAPPKDHPSAKSRTKPHAQSSTQSGNTSNTQSSAKSNVKSAPKK